LVASAVSQFESDKKQVEVTKVTDTLCKLNANSDDFIFKCGFVENFINPTEFYSNELTVQLAVGIK
jgi:hypothetical protein